MGKVKRRLTPLKSIRSKCLDCMCGQPKEVRKCTSTDCPLFEYRFGKNPSRSGIGGNINQLSHGSPKNVK
jgi:hypothetical protein